MVLDANLARFRGNLVAGALDRAKASPTLRVDRPAVSLADKTVALKRYDCTRGSLVQIVLDQFGDQIFALKFKKRTPEARHPIGLGHEAGAIALAGPFPGHRRAVGTHGWLLQPEQSIPGASLRGAPSRRFRAASAGVVPLGPSANRFTTLRTVSFFEVLPGALRDDPRPVVRPRRPGPASLDSCMTATSKLAR